MRSSTRLLVLPAAEQDLAEILRYTSETWGSGQAESYESVLRNAFAPLQLFPKLGRPSYDTPNERELILRHHTIRYRIDETVNTVTILRIVNPRRRSTPSR